MSDSGMGVISRLPDYHWSSIFQGEEVKTLPVYAVAVVCLFNLYITRAQLLKSSCILVRDGFTSYLFYPTASLEEGPAGKQSTHFSQIWVILDKSILHAGLLWTHERLWPCRYQRRNICCHLVLKAPHKYTFPFYISIQFWTFVGYQIWILQG